MFASVKQNMLIYLPLNHTRLLWASLIRPFSHKYTGDSGIKAKASKKTIGRTEETRDRVRMSVITSPKKYFVTLLN